MLSQQYTHVVRSVVNYVYTQQCVMYRQPRPSCEQTERKKEERKQRGRKYEVGKKRSIGRNEKALCATSVHQIFNLAALPAERPEIPYPETLGGADVPLVRAHQGGRAQNVRVQSCFLRGVPESQDMRGYANTAGDAHHGTEQRPKRYTTNVSFSFRFFIRAHRPPPLPPSLSSNPSSDKQLILATV